MNRASLNEKLGTDLRLRLRLTWVIFYVFMLSPAISCHKS